MGAYDGIRAEGGFRSILGRSRGLGRLGVGIRRDITERLS